MRDYNVAKTNGCQTLADILRCAILRLCAHHTANVGCARYVTYTSTSLCQTENARHFAIQAL